MAKRVRRPANRFAALLVSRMDELDVSATQLAAMVGVSRATIYRWRDTTRPTSTQQDSLRLVPVLAQALRLPHETLVLALQGADHEAPEVDEYDAELARFRLRWPHADIEQVRAALEFADVAMRRLGSVDGERVNGATKRARRST